MTTSIIPTTETVVRTVSRDLAGRTFVIATVGLRKLAGNAQSYWSATAEVYEPHGTWSGRARFNNDREPDSGGQCHDMILRAWPKLAPIIALHLSAPDGVPMYAVENGGYHLRQNDREAAARLWRCALDDLPEPDADGLFTVEIVQAFVDAQRERWARESSAAWAILQGLYS